MKLKRKFILKQEFIDDFSEALKWYSERTEKPADDLYNDVYVILKHIEDFPESFSLIQKNFRQAVLRKFPYVVVYKIYQTEIAVYSLFHTSRNPRKKLKRK